MSPSTFPTNGVHHATDEAIDVLYSYFPGATKPAPPCPEARFSATLRGKLGGVETLLTVRGMTSEEFRTNLQSIAGVLDPLPAPASPSGTAPGEGDTPQCKAHGVLRQGKRGWFCPRQLDDGTWCKSKAR